MSQGPDEYQSLVHQYGQTVTWSILLNISILCAIFKCSKLAAFFHIILGVMMFILTYFFVLWFLIPFGFIQDQKQVFFYYFHAIIGIALLGIIVLQNGSGIFINTYRKFKKANVKLLQVTKIFHISLGYFIAILYKFNILYNYYANEDQLFGYLVAWQAVCFVLWFLVKFVLFRKLEKIESHIEKNIVNEIKSIGEISNEEVVLFNGYVYDASSLASNHPGGSRVIELIVGRQVDRFLYGMYSAELYPQLPAHSHSLHAFKLLGDPIAKLVSTPTYQGFESDRIDISVKFISEVSQKSGIYIIGCNGKTNNLQFEGYSDPNQLIQHYSLTLNNSVTRLYTAVNFLTQKNITLMNKLIPELNYSLGSRQIKVRNANSSQIKNKSSIKSELLSSEGEFIDKIYLPLMFKVYSNGKLTSSLLTSLRTKADQTKLQLSSPKGLGLELATTKPGRIIIVAGGTGLFPFSDLIDLLYKSVLINENHANTQQIIQKNKILASKPFKNFKFVLLASANEPEDFHPITLNQLIYLSSHPQIIKIVLRVSKNANILSKLASKIEFTKDYFTKRVISEAIIENFSNVWICGPPRMATDTAQALIENGFDKKSFLLL